jgi:tagatose 1,6-diphosphate aldolase
MTKPTLTIGKLRGLQTTSSPKGAFTILAFDHRQSFVKMLDVENPDAVTYGEVAAAKTQIIKHLAPHASAVLTDPLYGAAQGIASGALPGTVGLLVAVEKTGYAGEATARVTEMIPGWNVAKIKQMGADAVKLLLYYHPGAGELAERQEALTAGIIAECREADIAFYLEPVSYSIDPENDKNSAAFAADRPALIAEIARRLGALGPDVLKLEFPVDAKLDLEKASWAEACRQVTEASPCPWAVLSAGVNFELFAEQVEAACKAGASGYIAGRAVWKEGIGMPTAQRATWLEDVAAKRMDRLAQIADQYAVPWQEYFAPVDLADLNGWYQAYGK